VELAFLGGMLTILSPCILPVLPFVFARTEQPFLTSGLPLLIGMALTFAAVATLAAAGGSWAVHINQYGRVIALVFLTAFAMTLLSRHAADWLARPFTALGNRLTQRTLASGSNAGMTHSLVLGVATGLLWAPCAGPLLGLILTGAAISGPNAHTTLLLFAYAAVLHPESQICSNSPGKYTVMGCSTHRSPLDQQFNMDRPTVQELHDNAEHPGFFRAHSGLRCARSSSCSGCSS
jgi:cytochrome c biogenesis protein CcdA